MPVLIAFSGFFLLMILETSFKKLSNQVRVLVVAITLTVALFSLCLIGEPVEQESLFVLHGLPNYLGVLFLCFSAFNLFPLWREKDRLEPEVFLFHLGQAALILALLLSNHLLLYILLVPTIYLWLNALPSYITLNGLRDQLLRQSTKSFVMLSVLLVVVLTWSHEYNTFFLSELSQRFASIDDPLQFSRGLPAVLGLFLLIFLAPFFQSTYQTSVKSSSWYVYCQAAGGLSLLGVLLFLKWYWLLAVSWTPAVGRFTNNGNISWDHFGLLIFMFVAGLIVLGLWRSRYFGVLILRWSQQILLIALLGTLVQTEAGFYWSLTHIFLFVVFVPLMAMVSLHQRTAIKAPRFEFFARSAWPRGLTLAVPALFILTSPLGNLSGLSLWNELVHHWLVPPLGEALVASWSLVSLGLVLATLMALVVSLGHSLRQMLSCGMAVGVSESRLLNQLSTITLALAIIVLGIYPTPLYKYLNFVITN